MFGCLSTSVGGGEGRAGGGSRSCRLVGAAMGWFAACFARAKARGDPATNQPVAAPTSRQLTDRTPSPAFTPTDQI